MMFMNTHEIVMASDQYRDHPVLGPATRTLENLAYWADSNSDGWAYWPKPCRSAAKLQALIQQAERSGRYGDPVVVTAAEYRKALAPVKAFKTRQGADFEIIEVAR